jgi:hypothetical protein
MITRRWPRPACGILLLALTATACAAPADPAQLAAAPAPPSPSAAAPDDLTEQQARTILNRYERLSERAARAGGAGLDRAESGLALQLSRAQYRSARLRGETSFPPRARIARVSFIRPRQLTGQARWFVAVITRAGTTGQIQLIFSETARGWRVVAGSATPSGRSLPPPANDADGRATALLPDVQGLAATPHELTRTHAAIMAGRDRGAKAEARLAPGPYTTQAAADIRAERAALAGFWRMRTQVDPLPQMYTVRTGDGGALVWYALRQSQTFAAVGPAVPPLEFTRRGPATLSRGRSFARQAVYRSAGWFVAVVPPATAAQGKPAIVGAWYAALKVQGQ